MEERVDRLYFEEEQRAPLLVWGPTLAPLAGTLFLQFALPSRDAQYALAGINILFLTILVLIYNMRFVTEVDSSCLRVRFSPFMRKDIPLSDIAHWKARTYDPIREYGGWGVRMWRGSGALNVRGNSGVQLVLVGGERLLIGSQRAYALAAAILLAKSESQ